MALAFAGRSSSTVRLREVGDPEIGGSSITDPAFVIRDNGAMPLDKLPLLGKEATREEATSSDDKKKKSYLARTKSQGHFCHFTHGGKEKRSVMDSRKMRLQIAVAICLVFGTVEVIGGILANSLAIMTDVAHLLSDIAGFGISIFALWASSMKATSYHSYGFYRLEILGAMASILIIWGITGVLVYQAVLRIQGNEHVEGKVMFYVAALGVLVNIGMTVLLGHDHEGASCPIQADSSGGGHHLLKALAAAKSAASGSGSGSKSAGGSSHGHSHGLGGDTNINVRGAFLHALGDLLQSLGVMFSGALIWYNPEWHMADPLCTFFFSLLVLLTTLNLMRDVVDVLMERVPRGIDFDEVQQGLEELDDVIAVHELHIWAITLGKVLLAVHLTVSNKANSDEVLQRASRYLGQVHRISHATIQIEREGKSSYNWEAERAKMAIP
eukprot:jgi/Mesvir1/17597/Mv08829-RA.1